MKIPDDWGPRRKQQAIDARREAQWLARKGMDRDDIRATLYSQGYPAAAVIWATQENDE